MLTKKRLRSKAIGNHRNMQRWFFCHVSALEIFGIEFCRSESHIFDKFGHLCQHEIIGKKKMVFSQKSGSVLGRSGLKIDDIRCDEFINGLPIFRVRVPVALILFKTALFVGILDKSDAGGFYDLTH